VRTATVPEPAVRTATRATALAFIGNGFAFATWAARIPQIRDTLHLSAAGLGLVLLAAAVGSVLGLPASGPVVHRWGARRTNTVTAWLLGLAFAGIAVGSRFGVLPLVVSLLFMGLAYGVWDVAMNVHGAQVEQRLGRAIMPRFHAGFSIGTVGGALVGALAVAIGVPVAVHLLVVAALVFVLVPLWVRGYLDTEVPAGESMGSSGEPRRSALAAWREPRTLLVGVFVLAFAFTEGTANDWIGVALIDGHGAPAAVGTLGFAVFLSAMTAARWFGPHALDRFGRVPVVRVLSAIALAGLLLFVLGPNIGVALLGALLWGAGTSLGFPVGMSAGSDDPAHAAGRVSVISSVGYCAFLAGPPLIGFLGEHLTVLRALLAVGVLLVVAAVLAPALRPPARADAGE
jgi:predicted MFS family arabinose efflux permease